MCKKIQYWTKRKKTLKLLAIGIILLVSSSIQAQVSVNLNIGTAPSWGLLDTHKQNTIICQMFQAYYDIRASQFVYFGNNRWVRSRYLQDNTETMTYTTDIKWC
jgi:hypothetical protein